MQIRVTSPPYFGSWQARVDLFRDVESALRQDPAGEPAQALVRRWTAQMEETRGGDPGVKAGLMKESADRQHWPATLRWQMVGLYMMSDERFDRAADFIDGAVAAEARAVEPELHSE